MRILLILAVLLIIVFVYLNRTYAYFYDTIGKYNLPNPNTEKSYILNNPASKNTLTYVALGDSLTAGVGADNYQETLPYNYAQNLTKDYSIIRLTILAVPGATTRDVIKEQLPKVLKDKPQYVTLLIGINDMHNFISLKEFEENYTKIVTEIRDKTGANIVLFTIPYLGSDKLVFFPYNILLDLQTKQYNNTIKNICLNKNFKCIDLYKASVSDRFVSDRANYSIDNFHPSGKGYKLFSEYTDANSN